MGRSSTTTRRNRLVRPSRTANLGWTPTLRLMPKRSRRSKRKLRASVHPSSPSITRPAVAAVLGKRPMMSSNLESSADVHANSSVCAGEFRGLSLILLDDHRQIGLQFRQHAVSLLDLQDCL